jgi:hypothetical protein
MHRGRHQVWSRPPSKLQATTGAERDVINARAETCKRCDGAMAMGLWNRTKVSRAPRRRVLVFLRAPEHDIRFTA